MRATINFEVDLDRVNETMVELVSTQVEYLIDAATCLSAGISGEPGNLLTALSETLEKIDRETAQLRQYRDMLLSFERARFETILPQPALATIPVTQRDSLGQESPPQGVPEQLLSTLSDMKKAVGDMHQFDGFLEKISLPAVPEEESSDDTEEG
jgi:hypothetical protein